MVMLAPAAGCSDDLTREAAAALVRGRQFEEDRAGWSVPVRMPNIYGALVDCAARSVTYPSDARLTAHTGCLARLDAMHLVEACEVIPPGQSPNAAPCSSWMPGPVLTADEAQCYRVRFAEGASPRWLRAVHGGCSARRK